MITLYDNDSDAEIGSISESQFDSLQEQLIEETIDSDTYNIGESTLASLELNGIERPVIELLRAALAGRTSMELRFEYD